MKANPVKGSGGAKAPVKKIVQSLYQASTLPKAKSAKKSSPASKSQRDAVQSLAGRAARADNKETRTAVGAEKKRQLAVKAAAAKTAVIRAVPPRYPRAVGTPYVPKSKPVSKSALPKTK